MFLYGTFFSALESLLLLSTRPQPAISMSVPVAGFSEALAGRHTGLESIYFAELLHKFCIQNFLLDCVIKCQRFSKLSKGNVVWINLKKNLCL
jgi:hypothetical protein